MILRWKNPSILLSIDAFFGGLVFFAPVALLVRTRAGITLSQFFILQLMLSLGILVFEIPAGILSDRIGYKKTLVLSEVLLLAARVLLLCARSFWAFALEALVESLSSCLASGTFSAYLYGFYQDNEYAYASSKIANGGTVGFLVSTISYSFLLPLVGITGLLVLTCASACFSVVSVALLPEMPKRAEGEGKERLPNGKGLLSKTWVFALLFGALSLAGLTVNFFYAPKVEEMALPVEGLSLLILGYSALELLSPMVIRKLEGWAQDWVSFWLLGAVALGFGLLSGVTHWAVLAVMLLLPMGIGVTYSILDKQVNQVIDSLGLQSHRATALSVLNMGNNLMECGFLLLSALATVENTSMVFCLAAVVLGSVAVVSLLMVKRR